MFGQYKATLAIFQEIDIVDAISFKVNIVVRKDEHWL
jgi:hypothetical protein